MLPTKFTFKRSLVAVEADHMSEPWLVQVKKQRVMVFDLEFVEISMQDRRLARALGLDCTRRSPFEQTTLLNHIAKLRNELVDELIMKAKARDDPLADDDDNQLALTKDRAKAFADAGLPQVVEIMVPGFTNIAGDQFEPRTLKVYPTPRRDGMITIEFSEDNLQWLSEAIHMEWDINGAPWVRLNAPQSEADLPALQFPEVCKYKHRVANQSYQIVAWYRLQSGNWKQCCRTLGNIEHMNEEMLKWHVRNIETQVMTIYRNSHHVPPRSTTPERDDE